ncbi:hypothetical protein LCGC14_2526400, partial [marine sediment metagenome]
MRRVNNNKLNRSERGVAYVLALLVLAVLSTLAVGLVTVGDINYASSANMAEATSARLAAESGMGFFRYVLGRLPVNGEDEALLLYSTAEALTARLQSTPNLDGAT